MSAPMSGEPIMNAPRASWSTGSQVGAKRDEVDANYEIAKGRSR